jgi:hypothetical protein
LALSYHDLKASAQSDEELQKVQKIEKDLEFTPVAVEDKLGASKLLPPQLLI